MSADTSQAARIARLLVAWGLLICGGFVVADEEAEPDLEFLEYLGSWEDTDETWMIFTAAMDEQKESQDKDNDEGSDPAPDGEKLAELDDEN